MVVIDGINYPDGTYKDEYGNVILPDGTKCVDVKVTLGESEQQEIENRMTENTLKKTAGGSPNRAFATLDELKQALPEGVVIPAEDYSSPYRGTKLVRENQHVYFYNTDSHWEDWGVYQGTMVSPDDPIIVDVRGDIQTVQDNLDLHIENANAKFSAIDTHQDLQDKRLDNHNDRLNQIENELHETEVVEVKESFTGNRINVPTSAEVEGRNFQTINNQLYKVSGIKGQSKKSTNLITYPYKYGTQEVKGVTYTMNVDGTIRVNGTATGGVSTYTIFDGYLPKGNYRIAMGDIKGTSGTTYQVLAKGATSIIVYDIKKGSKLVSTGGIVNVVVYVYNGNPVDILLEPMLNIGDYNIFVPFEKGYNGLKNATIKDITSVGSNRIPYPYLEGTVTKNGVKFEANPDGTIKVTGKATVLAAYSIFDGYLPKGEYIVSMGSFSGSGGSTYQVFARGEGLSFDVYNITTGSKLVSTGGNVQISIYVYSGSSVNILVEPNMIKGNTNTPRQPYVTDKTKEVNFTLKGTEQISDEAILAKTPNTELFEVDIIKRTKRINLWEQNWAKETGGYFTCYELTDAKIPEQNYQLANIICSKYSTQAAQDIINNSAEEGCAFAKSGTFMIRERQFVDVDLFKQYLLDNNVQLVYELKKHIIEKPTQDQNLSLGDVSVLGQWGGEFQINPIEPNIVEPKETSFNYDIKYWEQPTREGGNL